MDLRFPSDSARASATLFCRDGRCVFCGWSCFRLIRWLRRHGRCWLGINREVCRGNSRGIPRHVKKQADARRTKNYYKGTQDEYRNPILPVSFHRSLPDNRLILVVSVRYNWLAAVEAIYVSRC